MPRHSPKPPRRLAAERAHPCSAARPAARGKRGFTLIEVVVAVAVGLTTVMGVGLLSENLIRRRVAADSESAAAGLAELEMEKLLALANPSTASDLTAGTHGPSNVGVDGTSTLNGPYVLQWIVVDNATSGTQLIDPNTASVSKTITVQVTHVSNSYVRASLQTYYKY